MLRCMLCPLIFHMHCLPALGAVGRIESTVEVHLAFSHEGFSFLLGRYVIIAMAIQQIAEVPNVVQVFFFFRTAWQNHVHVERTFLGLLYNSGDH